MQYLSAVPLLKAVGKSGKKGWSWNQNAWISILWQLTENNFPICKMKSIIMPISLDCLGVEVMHANFLQLKLINKGSKIFSYERLTNVLQNIGFIFSQLKGMHHFTMSL